jgi:thiol:disulfide interchange protein DsbC
MKWKNVLIIIFGLVYWNNVHAACDQKLIGERVKQLVGDVTFDSIQNAPMTGWCELAIGAEVYYLQEENLFLISGDLLSLKNGLNLTNARRGRLVADILERSLQKDEILVIKSQNPKTYVTVFTDTDCPYCRKFHEQIPFLTSKGVEIRYLFYPRSGLEGSTFEDSVSIWCAKDRVAAITKATAGARIEKRNCPNPVKKHYLLGKKLNLTGTPTLFLSDGTRIGGYIPPEALLRQLGL